MRARQDLRRSPAARRRARRLLLLRHLLPQSQAARRRSPPRAGSGPSSPRTSRAVTIARKGETVRAQAHRRTAGRCSSRSGPAPTGRRSTTWSPASPPRAWTGRSTPIRPSRPTSGSRPRRRRSRLEVKGARRAARAPGGQQEPDRGLGLRARGRQAGGHHALGERRARHERARSPTSATTAVIAFDRRNVTGLDLDVAGDQIGLVADEPGKWRIVKPRALRADTDMVAEFLDKLEGAKAIEFVDDAPKSLAPYGLDKPSRVTVWLGRDKDRSSRTLLVGRPVPEKKGVYVKREGEPGVLLTAEAVWTALPEDGGGAARQDRRHLRLRQAHEGRDRARARRSRPREGRHRLEAHRTGGAQGRFVRGDRAPVEDPRPARRGLSRRGAGGGSRASWPSPRSRCRLWEDGAKEPKTLLLQSSSERRGGQPAAVAAVRGRGAGDAGRGQDARGAHARTSPSCATGPCSPPSSSATSSGRACPPATSRWSWRRAARRSGRWSSRRAARTKEGRVADVLLALRGLKWKEIAAKGGGRGQVRPRQARGRGDAVQGRRRASWPRSWSGAPTAR